MKITPDKGEGAPPSGDRPEVTGQPSRSFSEAMEKAKQEKMRQPLSKSREDAVRTLKQRMDDKQRREQAPVAGFFAEGGLGKAPPPKEGPAGVQPSVEPSARPPARPAGAPPRTSVEEEGAGFGTALSDSREQIGESERQQRQAPPPPPPPSRGAEPKAKVPVAPRQAPPPPPTKGTKEQTAGQKKEPAVGQKKQTAAQKKGQAKQAIPADTTGKKKEKAAPGPKGKVEQPQAEQPAAAIQPVQATVQTLVSPEQPIATSTGSKPVDQIVEVFMNNPMYGANVQQVSVAQTATETTVSVALQNGVQVRVQIAPGGKDLNILVEGVSAQAQAALDNPENQAMLTAKLTQQGFTVHQFATVRGEQQATTAAPTQAALRPEEREGGGQQQQPEPEPEPTEPEEIDS